MTTLSTRARALVARTPLPAVYDDVRNYVRSTPGKTLTVLLLAPVLVTLSIRLATLQSAYWVLHAIAPAAPVTEMDRWLCVFAFQFTLMFVIPVLCIKLGFREKLTEYGFQARPLLKLWPLVLVFLGFMLPITYVSSLQPAFRDYYPLYRGSYAGWLPFLGFEAGLFILFFTQEFFFRGFVIEALAPHLGYTSILISTAIYAVAHFTKPLPEQLGAFIVGNILGYIGLRYRTFYFGVIVHYGVALAMDSYLVVPALLHGR